MVISLIQKGQDLAVKSVMERLARYEKYQGQEVKMEQIIHSQARSNLPKLQKALVEREIIEVTESGIYLADPLFAYWFKREMM